MFHNLDASIANLILGHLIVPEATAVRAVCRATRDLNPLRSIQHFTLSSGVSHVLAAYLGPIQTMDVQSIPEPIVMRTLANVLKHVRVVRFHRNIRPLAEFRAIERLPALREFYGRIQEREAPLFLETLVADSPALEVLDAHFLGKCAKSLAVVSRSAWPNLRTLHVRGPQRVAPIPWRKSLEEVSYNGICTSAWLGTLPRLHTLVMHDDHFSSASMMQDLPALRIFDANVEGSNVTSVLAQLPEGMENLTLRVTGEHVLASVWTQLRELRKIKTLHVEGVVFSRLQGLSNAMEKIEVTCTWGAVESFAEAILRGEYPCLRTVYFHVVKNGDRPCQELILRATERVDGLEDIVVKYKSTSLPSKRKSTSYYRSRSVKSRICLEV